MRAPHARPYRAGVFAQLLQKEGEHTHTHSDFRQFPTAKQEREEEDSATPTPG